MIEGLIASVILCMAVLGVTGALTVASSQSSALDVDARSLTMAQQMMEQIVARPFDAPQSSGSSGGLGGATIEGGAEGAGGGAGGGVSEGAGEAAGESGGATEQGGGTRRSIGEFNNTQHYTTAVVGSGQLAESLSFRTDVFVEFRSAPQGPALAGAEFAMVTVVTTPSAKGAPVTLHRLITRYTKAGG